MNGFLGLTSGGESTGVFLCVCGPCCCWGAGPQGGRCRGQPGWVRTRGSTVWETVRLWLCVCEDLCPGLCMQTWSWLHCVWSLGVERSCIWVPSPHVPRVCLHARRLGAQTCPCSPDAFPRTLRLSSCKCVCVTFSLELCVLSSCKCVCLCVCVRV